jgi:enolase
MALANQRFATQRDLDQALIDLDNSADKSRLGANALLAVSLAFARAQAREQGIPLYQLFAEIQGFQTHCLPRPTVNLFSGGKHAGGQVAIQDVLIVPLAAATMDQALVTATAVYRAAAEQSAAKYGIRLLTADEGGLAPPFPDVETMLADAVRAIESAGYTPGTEVALAIDVAATHLHCGGYYHVDGQRLDSTAMIERLLAWLSRYPIISIEDGLAENAWQAWSTLRRATGGRALVLGDDLLCTNPTRIKRAIDSQAADALLLKVNQIGTVTEAAAACRLARAAGWVVVVSARSGETEDNWLSDLAVGWAADYIKIGSVTQSERLAKYNRLLEIERTTDISGLCNTHARRK